MLAVHRQKRMPRFTRRLCHQLAARDERLLIRQQHTFAAGKRLHDRRQSDDAHDGNQHVIRVARAHNVQQHVFTKHPLTAFADILRNFLRLNGQRRNLRAESANLLKELFAGAVRNQSRDLKAVAVARRNVQSLRANRPRRTQDSQLSHNSLRNLQDQCVAIQHDERKNHAVESIHHAAVTGKNLSIVLNTAVPLEQRRGQISDFSRH